MKQFFKFTGMHNDDLLKRMKVERCERMCAMMHMDRQFVLTGPLKYALSPLKENPVCFHRYILKVLQGRVVWACSALVVCVRVGGGGGMSCVSHVVVVHAFKSMCD